MAVYSPMSGVIDVIDRQANTIGIYIRGYNDKKQDDHVIHSPIRGTLVALNPYEGKIKRNLGPELSLEFKSEQDKRGRLEFVLANRRVGTVAFAVEVGAGYITDTVRTVADLQVGQAVSAHQHLGDIIIGSYCYVTLPKTVQISPLLRVTQEITANTLLASKPGYFSTGGNPVIF
jgi:hypothetical protein